MPLRHEEGATIRVFSGSSGETKASTQNHVPVMMVEMVVEPGTTVTQNLPGSYNGFIYLLGRETPPLLRLVLALSLILTLLPVLYIVYKNFYLKE